MVNVKLWNLNVNKTIISFLNKSIAMIVIFIMQLHRFLKKKRKYSTMKTTCHLPPTRMLIIVLIFLMDFKCKAANILFI